MSNPSSDDRSTHAGDDLFGALADGTRRRLLRTVYDRSPEGIGKKELATELAAVTNDKPVAAVDETERQRAHIDCQHRSLPALIDVGLVEETDDGTVVATDHPVYDDPNLEPILAGRTDASSAELDALFAALSDDRRRSILSALGGRRRRLSTAELARAVAALEEGTIERDVDCERVERVRTSLVHVHLPALSEAGLVAYDPDADRVFAENDRFVSAAWLVDESGGRTHTGSETAGACAEVGAETGVEVRSLEGSEALISLRQS
ncbi:hypothetical protein CHINAEXTREME_15095 [Halobiforma lacisalsi AJ5]|uniref:DUF7344 domain-containing protein n=1 Tax=Natronobacterium lacisalsi AJ5 TaxID=358396 RepID=M0LDT9_NATLA|nr:hypothetical protein [Halobiforma lacisalsi]APW99017.1 hypothetical protein CHINAEXTREME_15095 [Halobiforma lacisalsi AJ5]EMA31278.1 hypothetical protein C445_14519 [Halobiforma lacisalsi AJ5]